MLKRRVEQKHWDHDTKTRAKLNKRCEQDANLFPKLRKNNERQSWQMQFHQEIIIRKNDRAS